MDTTTDRVIPSLPLATSVPVLHNGHEYVTLRKYDTGMWDCARKDGGTTLMANEENLRVDLADPQGFGYALRFLGDLMDGADMDSPEIRSSLVKAGWTADRLSAWFVELLMAYLLDKIEDCHRSTLARALRAVMP